MTAASTEVSAANRRHGPAHSIKHAHAIEMSAFTVAFGAKRKCVGVGP